MLQNNFGAWWTESISKALRVITSDHANIHKSMGYDISGIFSSVASAAVVNYAFKTPTVASGKIVHLKFKEFTATGNKIKIDLYENPTNTPTVGSGISAINRYRVGTPVPTSMQAVKSGMTIDLTGATLLETAQFTSNGSRSLDIEFVLKPDTWYIRTFTNSTGAQADISYFEFWYEE